MPTATDDERRQRRLNAPVVRLLMWGAGYETLEQLADAIGVHKSQLGRAYRQQTQPSLHMLESLGRRFPQVPLTALIARDRDPSLRPDTYGLVGAQVTDVVGTAGEDDGGDEDEKAL